MPLTAEEIISIQNKIDTMVDGGNYVDISSLTKLLTKLEENGINSIRFDAGYNNISVWVK